MSGRGEKQACGAAIGLYFGWWKAWATCERAADPRLEDGSVSCPRSPRGRSSATEPMQQLGGEGGAGAIYMRMRKTMVLVAAVADQSLIAINELLTAQDLHLVWIIASHGVENLMRKKQVSPSTTIIMQFEKKYRLEES